jgi:hypothetical protein
MPNILRYSSHVGVLLQIAKDINDFRNNLDALFNELPAVVSGDEALQILTCIAENLSSRRFYGNLYEYSQEGDGSECRIFDSNYINYVY